MTTFLSILLLLYLGAALAIGLSELQRRRSQQAFLRALKRAFRPS